MMYRISYDQPADGPRITGARSTRTGNTGAWAVDVRSIVVAVESLEDVVQSFNRSRPNSWARQADAYVSALARLNLAPSSQAVLLALVARAAIVAAGRPPDELSRLVRCWTSRSPEQAGSTFGRRLNAWLRLQRSDRLFRRFAGTTVHGHLVEVRLNRAMAHIRAGWKIEAAMTDVGYRNRTAFNHAFSRRFGLRPSEARLTTSVETQRRRLADRRPRRQRGRGNCSPSSG